MGSQAVTQPVVLTDDEAAELYRFTRNSYINPNAFPALFKLISRVTARVEEARPEAIGPR